jgi:hypothetical protein
MCHKQQPFATITHDTVWRRMQQMWPHHKYGAHTFKKTGYRLLMKAIFEQGATSIKVKAVMILMKHAADQTIMKDETIAYGGRQEHWMLLQAEGVHLAIDAIATIIKSSAPPELASSQ